MPARFSKTVLLLSFAAASVAGMAQTPPAAQPMSGVSGMGGMKMDAPAVANPGPLKITFGAQSAEWTPVALAALPHVPLSVYNEHTKTTQTYSGVPLITLLAKVGVADKPKGKDLRLYLTAVGADGYMVTYSIAEVTPDIHDGTTIVADMVDGKSLGTSGVFQLVTSGEKRPARWVRNLAEIHVLAAQ